MLPQFSGVEQGAYWGDNSGSGNVSLWFLHIGPLPKSWKWAICWDKNPHSNNVPQSLWDYQKVPLVTMREWVLSDRSTLYQWAGHHLLLCGSAVIKGYWMIFLHCSSEGGVVPLCPCVVAQQLLSNDLWCDGVTPGCLLCSPTPGCYSERNVLIVATSSSRVQLCVTPLFHGNYGWTAGKWMCWDPHGLGVLGSCWGLGNVGLGIQLLSMLEIAWLGNYVG